MCGLAGYYLWEGLLPPSLEMACELLSHRGPDAANIWKASHGRVGLAHTRLSILDLSEAAHQPFHLEALHLTYNGEVYNFQTLATQHAYPLRTRSDTEVILWAYRTYGEHVATHLHGMFAFALYDEMAERLLLVRDPYGIKPLFAAQRPEGIYFASELKVLAAWLPDLEIEPQAIPLFLHLGFIPAPLTIYKGVYKVRPGEQWLLTPQGLIKQRYYLQERLWQQASFSGTQEALKTQIEATLRAAVRSHLVSDVPVGLLLSGGTDSSLVAALAVQETSDTRAFTIGFTEKGYNELPYAEKVAQVLGLPLEKAILTLEEALPLLLEIGKWYDEPFGDTSAVPTYLVSRLAAAQVKVVLAGDGGDELFGGYRRYELAHWHERWHLPILNSLWARIAPHLPHPKARRALRFLSGQALMPPLHVFSQDQNAFSWTEVKQLWPHIETLMVSAHFRDKLPQTPFLRQAAWEFLHYLPEDLLTKVDRASMQHSLEVRVPLLDRAFVELAWQVPLSYKWPLPGKPPQYKPLLRTLLKKYLPPALVERHKWGFALPLGQWMQRGPLSEWAQAMTAPASLESAWGIDSRRVKVLWQRFRQGQTELATRLWLLAQLGAFHGECLGQCLHQPQRLYTRHT